MDEQVGKGIPVPTIALVEPDADVREFISNLLISAGYQCETFVSAERYERFAADTSVQFLITDSDLPGMDGIELARRVRSSKHPIPVMLLTSDSDGDLEHLARAADVMRVQKKPLGVREFLQSVAAAVGFTSVH